MNETWTIQPTMPEVWERNIVIACVDPRTKRKDIALMYAYFFKVTKVGKTPNFCRVNEAILKRYKPSGLAFIRKLAWDYLEGRKQP